MPDATSALRLHVSGVVQGVGFRPFIHRLAARHRLGGWIRNTDADVEIAIEGDPAGLDGFIQALRGHVPPLVRIDHLQIDVAPREGLVDFTIGESATHGLPGQVVTPDIGICADCERELLDPHDRRYRYPFITCTNCGPRYSVIDSMPYDRERTSMRAFVQCPACCREYEDIGDRRYHSETNSCPACGPRLGYVDARGDLVACADPVAEAARALKSGAIVAVRGLGGFHLAVDAQCETAVARLRARKRRDGKPFAVLVRSLDAAEQVADLSAAERTWLAMAERPIVIAPRAQGSEIARSVSLDLGTIGVMLAYTPLHILLTEAVGRPVVLTSGNPSGLPLAASLAEALANLGDIADGYLTHDREIVARVDDSVVRLADAEPVILRRARGFAPLPLPLPVASPVALVAVGPHLKNTFTVATGGHAFVSPHIGDLDTLEAEEHWVATFSSLRRLFGIEPRVAARDLHPEYSSTRLAAVLPVERVLSVQHHHAHIAAVAAEHGVRGRVIGVAYDGTGYGTDGHTWGAEFLVADLTGYRRAGHLRYAPLPGADLAARTPWRAALGYQSLLEREGEPATFAFNGVERSTLEVVRRQIDRGVNCPLASSMGRLFDAAAAILGICLESRFEGEAAIRLETMADGKAGVALPFDTVETDEGVVLDPLPLLLALSEARRRGRDAADLAADFHQSIAVATARLAARFAEQEGLDQIALGGGVFQNARLLRTVVRDLERRGFAVLRPRQLPPNDGAISYGQAAIAAARLALDDG